MTFKLSLIVFLLLVIAQSNPATSQNFCMSLCKFNSCSGNTYQDCTSCTNVTDPSTGTAPFSCVAQSNTTYMSSIARYQPIGIDDNYPFALQGLFIPASITVSDDSSGTNTASTMGNCTLNATFDYSYYGNWTKDTTVKLSLLSIDPSVNFYKIVILLGIITIDEWDPTSTLNIKFNTNTSQTTKTFSTYTPSSVKNWICGDPMWSQKSRNVQQQFSYGTRGQLDFTLTITGNSKTNPWGLKQVAIFARLCHPYCLTCTGDGSSSCQSCDYVNTGARLKGTSCALTCPSGYGIDSANPSVCLLCATNCTSCLDTLNNCLTCTSSHYLYDSGTTINCISPCPAGYFINSTAPAFCQICDTNCKTCISLSTRCLSCDPLGTTFLFNFTCVSPCPDQTYSVTASQSCQNCNNFCYICSGTSTNCTVCDTTGSYISYLLPNKTCVVQCGNGYFQDTQGGSGPNLCTTCDLACTTCDKNSTYCFKCNPSYYLSGNTCGINCTETGYFADNNTWKCLPCSSYCVALTTTLSFNSNLKQKMYYDLTFNYDLNWTITDIADFVKISQNDSALSISSNFIISYQILTTRKYRVILEPKGYIFIYNVTFTFSTITFNGTDHYSAIWYPFNTYCYGQSSNLTWFLIKAPSMSDTEKSIVDGVSKMSDSINSFTTKPYLQEIKKSGILGMLLGGAQATSLSCLVNNIPSQNFYEGSRFWASFVFFDVPQWQQNSNKSKYVVSSEINDVIKDARIRRLQPSDEMLENHLSINRLLFNTSQVQWRFQRTGSTSFFIFDVYINIFLIVLCWILLIVGKCCIKQQKKYKSILGKFYSFTLKVHEITLFYITISTLLQWIYFDASSLERWISFSLCIMFNLYFLIYELYIYSDMINYPAATIGNEQYDYYCLKYGSLLKNIRYEEYDSSEQWSPKHWFRPYNFHILSYYKKFIMLISLPLFYNIPHAQISCLIAIQALEICRFLVVWPFKSRVRNIIRLCLDLMLLTFFVSNLIQGLMVQVIMINDANTIENSVSLFYTIGWVGFCMVFAFNIGYVLIFIFDIIIGCKYTNRQLMDEARKNYYMQKLNQYEQDNEDAHIGLINKWVKLGNLNDRKYEQLPDINLRLQYFRIKKSSSGLPAYQVEMKKLLEVFMNIEFNYQAQNNMTSGKKINKRFTLTKSLSPMFYNIIDALYQKYESNHMQFQYLVIKTFQKIVQSSMKAGQKVHLKVQEMDQKIEIETYAGQIQTIKLDKMLTGFPIPEEMLENID